MKTVQRSANQPGNLLLPYEFGTTVDGQKILFEQLADSAISAGAATGGTQAIDTPEMLFRKIGLVIEVITVSAATRIRCFFCAEKKRTEYIHVFKLYDNLSVIFSCIYSIHFSNSFSASAGLYMFPSYAGQDVCLGQSKPFNR